MYTFSLCFPLAFCEMSLLPFCTKTAHFLTYFLDFINTHTSTILYQLYPFSVAFSYYLLTYGLFVSPYINCTAIIHLIFSIYYNRHIYYINYFSHIISDPYTITIIHIIHSYILFHKCSSIITL